MSVVYCLSPGDPRGPGMQLPTPESPGVKIMDGVGFPSTQVSHYMVHNSSLLASNERQQRMLEYCGRYRECNNTTVRRQ